MLHARACDHVSCQRVHMHLTLRVDTHALQTRLVNYDINACAMHLHVCVHIDMGTRNCSNTRTACEVRLLGCSSLALDMQPESKCKGGQCALCALALNLFVFDGRNSNSRYEFDLQVHIRV